MYFLNSIYIDIPFECVETCLALLMLLSGSLAQETLSQLGEKITKNRHNVATK